MQLIKLFTLVTPIRKIDGVDAFADVERHLPDNHVYGDSDKITHVHECTHGINGLLRNIHKKPCFYTLENRCVTLDEPKGTMRDVAKAIPRDARGPVYKLYLVDQRRYWNDQPSYVFDELSAYINGARQRYDQKRTDREGAISYMAEFITYSLYVAKTLTDDLKTKAFLRYQIERAIALGASQHLKLGALKDFVRSYFGTYWCEKVLGI